MLIWLGGLVVYPALTVIVGFARTDDGHNQRQGATFARSDDYFFRGESTARTLWLVPTNCSVFFLRSGAGGYL